jgi:ABC-2 type transport system ATP-binding protein
METVIKVEKLTKQFRTRVKQSGLAASLRSLVRPEYRTVDAVAGIDFEVCKGEIVAFIGPNGAGKSTTIKLITGILYPDNGSISVLGLDPHKQRRRLAYHIGTVFGQKSQLWFHLPALDSFHLLGTIYDIPKAETDRRIDYLKEIFELGEFIDQPVRRLSLGQRIRCEIAGSLIHEPDILFLDEPSIGLDVVVKKRIRDLIKRINTERSVTIFLTSHDAGDIEKLCRRAMVINHGRIVWDGSVNEMRYTLLNRRLLAVRMDGPAEVTVPGARVLKRKKYAMKIEVDLSVTRTEDVITELMKQSAIEDITISSTPMEDVITHIYQTGDGGSPSSAAAVDPDTAAIEDDVQ